jgi:hypothetical protein
MTEDQQLRVGEVARATGLTVRALHHYFGAVQAARGLHRYSPFPALPGALRRRGSVGIDGPGTYSTDGGRPVGWG